MGKEIERKWLPESNAARELIRGKTPVYLEQGYLSLDPVLRVRKEGETTYFTCKGKGFLEREECNLPISSETYLDLFSKCGGRIIQKYRYRIPFGSYTIELDQFVNPCAGMFLLEIEFPDIREAASFCAPAEFGREVMEDPAYTNAMLSLQFQPSYDTIHD